MSFFDKIKTAIFGEHGPLGGGIGGSAKPAAAPTAPPRPVPTTPGAAPTATAQPIPAPATPAPAAPPPADVEAILTEKAAARGKPSNWRTSIVDLLQLIDLDSSLTARKELATELGVRVGADGSAEQNVALHKAVMRKLAENGGKVPASLQD